VQFLNRHLSSNMFRNKDCLEPLLDFLRVHTYKGHVSLLCNAFFFLLLMKCLY
jgi:sucrose synthase